MKIIVPQKISKMILEEIKITEPNETKGALYAKYITTDCYEIEDVYISKEKGTRFFSNLIINLKYKKFDDKYFKKTKNDYVNHNYIGDWHSHPSFSCVPSSYDVQEAFTELQNSNANFLIQMILKNQDGKLIGECFLYKRGKEKEKCDLFIE